MNPENIENVEQQELQEEHFKQSEATTEVTPEETANNLNEQINTMARELVQKEEEKKQLAEKVKLAQAELINYRKRKDEETQSLLKYANQDLILEIIPVVDNFERAISMDDNNFGDETSKFLEGFRMVYNQTRALLEKFEVKEIVCIGKEFDPSYAQAVVVEKNEEKESGVVLEVLQKGYMYKDRVLRIAMVKVNE